MNEEELYALKGYRKEKFEEALKGFSGFIPEGIEKFWNKAFNEGVLWSARNQYTTKKTGVARNRTES